MRLHDAFIFDCADSSGWMGSPWLDPNSTGIHMTNLLIVTMDHFLRMALEEFTGGFAIPWFSRAVRSERWLLIWREKHKKLDIDADIRDQALRIKAPSRREYLFIGDESDCKIWMDFVVQSSQGITKSPACLPHRIFCSFGNQAWMNLESSWWFALSLSFSFSSVSVGCASHE